MKRIIPIIAAFIMITTLGVAQELKIGYVQVEKVFAEWPQTKNANTELQQYEESLSKQLQDKVNDFQTKLEAYQSGAETMTINQRKTAETDLQNKQTEIQQFEASAQQLMSEKNLALLTPLQDTLKKTIEQVARENGFTHVLTYGSALVFTTDTTGDISGKIAQKLGFTLSQ